MHNCSHTIALGCVIETQNEHFFMKILLSFLKINNKNKMMCKSLKLIEFLTHHAYGICCNMMRELDCHFKFKLYKI